MVRAHRQAWVWQDEWIGLTIKDIRRLERETQIILRKKLGKSISNDDIDGNVEDSSGEDDIEATLTESTVNTATKSKAVSTGNGSVVSGKENTEQQLTSGVESSLPVTAQVTAEQTMPLETPTHKATANTSHTTESGGPMESHTERIVSMRHSIDAGELAERRMSRKSASLRRRSLKKNSRHGGRQSSLPDSNSMSASAVLSRRRTSSTDTEYLPSCALDAVAIMNMSSDDEYYDALGELFS